MPKSVNIVIQDSVYEHLEEFLKCLNERSNSDFTLSYYLSCCVVNHLIEKGILNEFGLPEPFSLPPKLEFDTVDFDELSKRDYDSHYCENHDSYYCPEIDSCNPENQCFPAMNKCKAYRRNK